MPLTKDDILEALRTVEDPELHRDLVTLDAVKHVAYCDGAASIELQLNNNNPAIKAQIKTDAEAAVRALGDEIKQVAVTFAVSLGVSGKPPESASQQGGTSGGGGTMQDEARASNPLPQVKHIIAVGAGKGGVGKSTVAVNMAIGLARAGHRVGLMDGDIYGPSLPTMLGTADLQPQAQGKTIMPFEVHGIQAMSLGCLVEEEKALIWRGPMAHGAFKQLATQTAWGDLDYLVIDLPPGTGDVPLTMSQLLPLTGAVVVCTPQKVAQDDARRAVAMFRQLGIEVLGMVENMSYFIGDDGKEYDIFGRGGAEMMAQQMGVPFLGRVPINTRLRLNADAGDPSANFTGDDQLASELEALVEQLNQQVTVAVMSGATDTPTLSIS